MASTFGGLSIAHSGLNAARAALEVAGQNIANANTTGYTRQRIETSSLPAPALVGRLLSPASSAGQGVSIDGVSRLADSFLDLRVRSSSAVSGYANVRASALSDLEATFNEPGDQGISTELQTYWGAWQDLANNPGGTASGAVVIEQGSVLAGHIATGYQAVDTQWSVIRSEADGQATSINDAADQIASLNSTIRTTIAAGGSVNEMVDQRSSLAASIAELAGGTVNERPDGTIDILIGGNPLVSGNESNHLQVNGSYSLQGAATSTPRVEWASKPGVAVGLDGGALAGSISLLGPANADGTGGVLAEVANSYNELATRLNDQVNAIHMAGSTTDGTTGLKFFDLAAGSPAALGLTVVPTSVSQLATGKGGSGALDGSNADAISQIGSSAGSPDTTWSNLVSKTAVLTRSELQQASLAELGRASAVSQQLSSSSVDLDEENVNLLSQQSAYQAAARVLTAIDEMLDTLINRTGLVGR